MKAALEGYRFIAPNIEYHDRMTINLGGRTFELMYLKGVRSESDSAVWLPNERVLFSASAFVVNQINILRPFVTIPDILAAGKMMKALNPEHVVPGHGTPGAVKIFEDGERYYALLLDRVGKLMKEGKSLDLTLPDLQPVANHQPADGGRHAAAKRLNPIKLKQMQDRCRELEEQIAESETEIAHYEAELANFVNADETIRLSALLEKRRSDLSGLLAEWEEVSQVVESQQA